MGPGGRRILFEHLPLYDIWSKDMLSFRVTFSTSKDRSLADQLRQMLPDNLIKFVISAR
jgi:hypothetical protein